MLDLPGRALEWPAFEVKLAEVFPAHQPRKWHFEHSFHLARITDEGEGSWRLLLSDGTPPHEVLAALVAAGASVDRFEPLLAPMEDIFVRVVKEGRA